MGESAADGRRTDVPLLEPTPGGPAERIGGRLAGLHPVVAFVLSAVAIWVLVVGVSILLGLLVTEVLVPIDAVQDADEWLPDELAAERTSFWNDVSYVVSTASGGYRPSGDPRRPDGDLRLAATLARGRLHDRRARARVRDLPRHVDRGAARAARGGAAGEARPRRELPVRAHRRVARRLRRAWRCSRRTS